MRAMFMVESGKADAITYLGKTREREDWAVFNPGNKLSATVYSFIVRAEPLIIEAHDLPKLKEMLISKRADIALVNKTDFYFLAAKTNQQDQFAFLEPSVSIVYNYIAFSRNNDDRFVAEPFAKAMEDFRKTVAYAGLMQAYLPGGKVAGWCMNGFSSGEASPSQP